MTEQNNNMTRDEKIRILRSVRAMDALINQKQEELDELRSQAVSISIDYSRDRVQTSGTSDRVGNAALAIIELEQYINDMIDKYIDLKSEIAHCIDAVGDPMERAILEGRYMLRKTWKEIGQGFNPVCSRQWLSKRHNDAVDDLSLSMTCVYTLGMVSLK